MTKNSLPEHIVGLDIGTDKVAALIAREAEGGLELLGYGLAPNHGMQKGAIINLESTQEAIEAAIEQADMMCGVKPEAAYVSASGSHVKGFNSRGSISLPEDHPKINSSDIANVIAAARAVAIPNDREVIHLLTQEFIVNDEGGIQDPLGFSGHRLEACVHMVSCSHTAVQNTITCTQNAGLEVQAPVLSHLASGLSTLDEDEKDLGVAMLDIGAGTVDLAVFINGYLWHTAVLAIAGYHITNDIAVGLRTPVPTAEAIKLSHGAALGSAVQNNEGSFEVPSIGEGKSRVVEQSVLIEIINARTEEILHMVKMELNRIGILHQLNAGIVLTGGTANMPGILNLAEQVFETHARIAVPKGFGGIIGAIAKPEFATLAGLVRYGWERSRNDTTDRFPKAGLMNKLKGMFKSNV